MRGFSPTILNVVARLRGGMDIATAEMAVRQIHARRLPNAGESSDLAGADDDGRVARGLASGGQPFHFAVGRRCKPRVSRWVREPRWTDVGPQRASHAGNGRADCTRREPVEACRIRRRNRAACDVRSWCVDSRVRLAAECPQRVRPARPGDVETLEIALSLRAVLFALVLRRSPQCYPGSCRPFG